jgi:hypothetical protein
MTDESSLFRLALASLSAWRLWRAEEQPAPGLAGLLCGSCSLWRIVICSCQDSHVLSGGGSCGAPRESLIA